VSRANEIYKYSRSIERELENLRSDVNYRTIKGYFNQRMATGISPARQYKCINTLKLVSKMLKKPFKKTTKKDMIELLAELEQKPFSTWTKRDYKIIIKKFYQWLYGHETGEYPDVVKWIRPGFKMQNLLKKSDLLTADEIRRLAESARTLRDRAFILVLAESGRRVGEILTLRIGDIEFDNLGARLLVDGKTGRDYVRIMSSAPMLATWIDNHPRRDDQTSPVWVGPERYGVQQLSYTRARLILKDCVTRAKITKRVWFHLFRHTRGTEASTKLNSQQLCALMGWRQGSDMPSVYIHLSGEDIDKAQAVMNGVHVEKEEKPKMEFRICNRCEYKNSFVSKFCNKCGLCLDLKTAFQLDQARNKIDVLFEKLTEDPEKLEKVMKILQQ